MDVTMGARGATVLMLALAVAGCGRLGVGESGGGGGSPAAYEPLPAPQPGPQTVTAEPLQPLPGQAPAPGGAPMAGEPAPAYPGQNSQGQGYPAPSYPSAPPPAVASASPANAPSPDRAMAVTKTQFSGGWSVTSGGETCQLFANLTTWSGGMRAIAKGCTSPDLQRISAWTLEGKQILLKGNDGSIVASLYANSPEQFSGQTASRQAITLTR